MANVTKPIILDETGQAIVEKLDAIADAMTPPTAEDIATSAISGVDNVEDALDFVNDKIDEKTAGVVKSVNAIHPDAQGEVKITNVAYSDNFTSDKTQNSEGEFIIRTAGGDASISDGDAFVTRVYGNRVHTGYSPESLNMEVTMTPRVAPDPITAALNAETFEAYVSEAGIYTLTYTSSWSADPSLYGVTVTGTPLSGDSIEIDWDGESEPYMTVTAPRVAPDGISATINRDTFVGYVSESGVTTLTYTTMWSANPALYGVTVTGTPVSGDYITITYYKEQRGTIAVATPSAFKSTWWNLYNHTAGYAYLTKYSTQYGFRIGGTYTALQYSETLTGTKSSITPVDGVFTIPGDGYVWVTGGNNTNTYIINQWSDWTDGPAGEFEAYSESTINLATIMNTYFPYGLLRVGVIRDEINVNASLAISKIDRMAYNAENLASAKASGRAYEYDSNYIYIVKASYDSNSITLDGDYMASDHGNEFFVGTSVPVYLETMYGNNLKNKLERDVVTISQQTLTSAQQTQVRNNLSAASQADITTLNGSISTLSGRMINDVVNLRHYDYVNKIKSGDDLNDYCSPGTYACIDAATCNSLLHKPDYLSSNFRLYVLVNTGSESGNGNWWGMQFIIRPASARNGMYIFMRGHADNEWSPWTRFDNYEYEDILSEITWIEDFQINTGGTYFYVNGRIANLTVETKATSVNSATVIGNLTVNAHRPWKYIFTQAYDYSSGKPINGSFWIAPSGAIWYYGDSVTSKRIGFSFTYIY